MSLTTQEAKIRAAQYVLEAICEAQRGLPWRDDPDSVLIAYELHRIEKTMLLHACGGDKILIRQLERETGRQVKPAGKRARAIERLATRAEKPPARQE